MIIKDLYDANKASKAKDGGKCDGKIMPVQF